MSRSHDPGKDHFDLLPFISILICTLGCLLFVTLSVAAISLHSPGETWSFGEGGQKVVKHPLLVEWDGKEAIWRVDGVEKHASWDYERYKSPTVSADDASSPELKDLLSLLYENKDTTFALVAVRTSGFESFLAFSTVFRQRKIDLGYEPIENGARVRLAPEGSNSSAGKEQ
jgi:hypothetical protein